MPLATRDQAPSNDLRAAWDELLAGLEARGYLANPRARAAMRRYPRPHFVGEAPDPAMLRAALADSPLSIGHGQTISAPHMVAVLLSSADPRPGERVLEVGAGSGWLLALLADLVGPEGHVIGVEVVPELADLARSNLQRTRLDDRAEVVRADGSLGHAAGGPYDLIIVSCAAPRVPRPLLDQLAPGGRMVIPVGDQGLQHLLRITRTGDGLREEDMGRCAFVPLVGEWGFPG